MVVLLIKFTGCFPVVVVDQFINYYPWVRSKLLYDVSTVAGMQSYGRPVSVGLFLVGEGFTRSSAWLHV